MSLETKIWAIVIILIGCAGVYAKWKSDEDDNDNIGFS